MYTIKPQHNSNNNIEAIELENANKTSYAKILLNLGASLQELKLGNKILIEDLTPLDYKNTYASSILFPFANRIKDGEYTFNNETFSFPVNEPGNNNALHGLVFDKTFEIVKQEATEHQASLTLVYNETLESKGFPYTYTIQLEYILKDTTLDLNVSITNTDTKAFPFTLGWHPYFVSKNLYESSLNFDSNQQLILDERCITTGTKTIENTSVFNIEDKKLDDCFILNSNEVQFNTPDYKVLIHSTSKESFLQIYTPPRANTIAIEPTTGVSDSFNNKMGLQILTPSETYHLNWNIKLL
ncbi:aldose 1-epimerase [Siansivirga zeaxanthinifaciens]|uniref:Aldose epimerase n=1 Tax=Siansivirga zeaxanthinifaciens CC-SAMT-1 TaxID=1454006 RepID=A0A0C5WCE3_9FLAO|nr:aldose 1-epimerase [Siansivirga zeaxanthinifaciens]AJR03987.1 hypothetical protein AW14_10450 [Siansivirga zeaxanthinifaciens CC-SAMT-1]